MKNAHRRTVVPAGNGTRVMLVGGALVLVQLAFRGWTLTRAWFQQDDFAFMQRSLTSDLDWEFLMEPHVGHLMPGGFLLSWVNNAVDPLAFALPASELLVMQALASVSCLLVLRHMFGARWGILPPLAIFLFSPITFPAFSWWAAGVNQLPFLAVLFLGLHTHITYMRQGTFRHAVYTVLWTVLGLLFVEKTLLVFGVFAIVTLAYFTQGHLADRVKEAWDRYRAGVILYAAVPLVYVPYYYVSSINFDATEVGRNPILDLAYNMLGVAFATGVTGGPVSWASANVFSAIADPSDLFLILSWLAIGAAIFIGARTRERSKRAWLLPLAILLTDVLLVATGRAFVVGPIIGLEYRYQTEAAAVAAIAAALAFLPLLGAKESAELKATPHPVLDERKFWTVALPVFVGLSVFSTLQFMAPDLAERSPRRYFANFESTLAKLPKPVPLADRAVPERIWTGFAFPGNLYSAMFLPYEDQLAFPDYSIDSLYMVDDSGRIAPVRIDPVRRDVPGDSKGCPHPLNGGRTEIPLDGPVIGGGWWVRVEYFADGPSQVSLDVGDHTFDVDLPRGARSIFVKGDGEFDEIVVARPTASPATVCVTSVELGTPEPVELR